MKRIYIVLLFTSQLVQASPLKVIIDPGHGGKDHGVTRGSIREADIALQVSQKLGQLLSRDRRFDVSFTRQVDQTVSLNRRTEIASEQKADLLISIHANSNKLSKVRGPEFYLQSVMPADEYAQFLANRENNEPTESPNQIDEAASSHDDLANILHDLRRGHQVKLSAEFIKSLHRSWYPAGERLHSVKQAPFHVISQTNAASALIELGFVTNPEEAKMLSQNEYQLKAAERILQALITYKETLDKQRARPLH